MERRFVRVNERGRAIGEDHHRAKLSDADIDLILELRDGGMSYGVIASKLDHVPGGVAKSTVRDICTGRIRGQVGMRVIKRCESSSSGKRNT